jgi:carboxypeptidase Taq
MRPGYAARGAVRPGRPAAWGLSSRPVTTISPNGRPAEWARFQDWMALLSDLGGAIGLVGWDREVSMPPRGAEARGRQLGTLAALAHRELTRGDVEEALAALEEADGLDGDARAMIVEARRARGRAQRIPEALVRAEAEASSRCVAVWIEARPANDFASLATALEPLVEIKRRIAEALAIGDEPYDGLLDEYEPGTRTRDLEPLFAELRSRLVPLIEPARARSGQPLPRRPWPQAPQMELADRIARAVGFDLAAGVIAVSAHPFTQGTGRGDVRFTTKPDESDPQVSIMSTLHELGHALYEQNFPAGYEGTVLYDAPSMGAHESQSRFWENHVGRLPAFWRFVAPELRARFPEQMAGLGPEELQRAVTRVAPSLIRIEADEVTYNLHIALRFELELALIRGDLPVADLPGAWEEGMERLLGLRPPTDADGVMQDIHWPSGAFGYFPTYTLGNLYAAQLTEALEAEIGPLEPRVEAGEFAPVLEWMRDRVHARGRRLTTPALMREATGRELGVDAFVAHLERAYVERSS